MCRRFPALWNAGRPWTTEGDMPCRCGRIHPGGVITVSWPGGTLGTPDKEVPMATLTAWKFDTPNGAAAAEQTLLRLQTEELT
jgi:hypothetical protein